MPDRVLAAIDRLADALERFRVAYEAWLAADATDDAERRRLTEALAEAERCLDDARAELESAQTRLRL